MKIYSTNELCQLCGVSRKQLRYYEERGLLSEVQRQDGNNYRCYTPDHIYNLVAAKALRNIDMSIADMQDVIYGSNVNSIQRTLQSQLISARENLENSLRQYEQSAMIHAKLAEAISYLHLHYSNPELGMGIEVVDHPRQDVIALPYSATFEDEDCCDVEFLPKIQMLSEKVNSISFSELIYITYDHYDSKACHFDDQIHDYKIAVPVFDRKKSCAYYDTIPEFRGVSTLHFGSPKNKQLYNTYMRLLRYAKEKGYELENWSFEEWMISPMITNNEDLWVIRVIIPFKNQENI